MKTYSKKFYILALVILIISMIACISEKEETDVTVPVVSIQSPLDGSTITSDTPVFNYSVNESGKTVIKLDGEIIDINAGDNLPALSDGQHTIIVNVTDPAGNIGTTTSTFTIDTSSPTDITVPVVSIQSPLDGNTITSDTPVFNYSVNESGKTVIKLDEEIIDINAGDNLPALSDGQHTIIVNVTDPAGNTGTTTSTFTIDTSQNYSCPDLSTINCMPLILPQYLEMCSGDYHDWIKINCPDVKFVY